MKLATIAVAICLLAGCSTPPPPKDTGPRATAEEEAAARNELQKCQTRAIAKYDDKSSDPKSVGAIVVEICLKEGQGLLQVLIKGRDPVFAAKLIEIWPDELGKLSVNAVMSARASGHLGK